MVIQYCCSFKNCVREMEIFSTRKWILLLCSQLIEVVAIAKIHFSSLLSSTFTTNLLQLFLLRKYIKATTAKFKIKSEGQQQWTHLFIIISAKQNETHYGGVANSFINIFAIISVENGSTHQFLHFSGVEISWKSNMCRASRAGAAMINDAQKLVFLVNCLHKELCNLHQKWQF